MWKGAESKKTRKLTHDEIRRKLIESLVMNDTIETDELTRRVQELEDPEKVAEVIGKVFKKFKDKEKFITIVNKLGIHKTTIIFKINIFKLCEKYPKFFNSSIGLGFFKNHYKEIRVICNEKAQEFS